MCRFLLLALMGLAAQLVGCGGPPDALGGIPVAQGPPDFARLSAGATIRGTVRFEKLPVTNTGLSSTAKILPARRTDVIAVVSSPTQGVTTVTATTDDSGRYSLNVPVGSQVVLGALSSSLSTGRHTLGVFDLSTNQLYVVTSPTIVVNRDSTVDLTATTATPGRLAGAFNILDTAINGDDLVRTSTGRGVTASFRWRAGQLPGTFAQGSVVTLNGGILGQATSDTDEFDDNVILHEYGHVVLGTAGKDNSRGGAHNGTFALYPTLAYSEGFSDFYSGAVLKDNIFRDTVGTGASTRLGLVLNLEEQQDPGRSLTHTIFGIGSEESVFEVLWDLADGGVLPNSDSETVAKGGEPILQAILSLDDPARYVHIIDHLDVLQRQGLVSLADITTVLATGGGQHQSIQFPPPVGSASEFPIPVVIGEDKTGRIDSNSLGTVGGRNANESSINSRAFFRLRLSSTTSVSLSLTTTQDLDLYALTTRNAITAKSVTRAAGGETISGVSLPAGTHIIMVTGFVPDALFDPSLPGTPRGSKSSFTLQVR